MLEFVIEHHEAGVIGVTGLSEFSLRDRRAVVGTWHGRSWWGTGANRQSKALVLGLAFRGLGLGRVTAWCGTDNGRSQTALERVGFVHEGVLRQWHVHSGEPKDVISYGMLRSDWEASILAEEPFEIIGRVPPQFVAE
jgi:N-acetyltransferase